MTLRTLLDSLPDTALVPVGWLRSQLDGEPASATTSEPDMDVATFAKLVRRSTATVRTWCERGVVPGAYQLPGVKRRGAWRIPAASVAAFRAQLTPGPRLNREGDGRRGGTDLGRWRGVMRRKVR